MPDRVVPLDGQPVSIREERIPLVQLRLDPTNPRVQYQLDSSLAQDVTQEALGFALAMANDSYEKLRENIEANGGIVNPIWVAPEANDDTFLIIEGNTRVQIYMDLREKYPNKPDWQSVPAFILPHRFSREQVNFIRLEAHLFGSTPWDAYEKARELYRLNTEEDYSLERLSRLTKMSISEIRTNIQAFRDMREQYLPRFLAPEEHQKFSYFVEFRKNAELKRLVNANKLNVIDFANWVGEGKFRRGEDVRRLGEVLKDPEAHEVFDHHNFPAALDQLAQKNPGATSPLFDRIDDVIAGLKGLPFHELDYMRRGLAPIKVERLKSLQEAVGKVIDGLT
jgi:ParB-like nuclease domain